MTRYHCLSSCGGEEKVSLIDLKRHAEVHATHVAIRTGEERRRRAAQLLRIRGKLRQRNRAFLQEVKTRAEEQVNLAIGNLESGLLQQLEQESLPLILGIVERFLGKVLPNDERYLAGALRTTLQKLQDERMVVLSYHPRNEGIVQKLRTELNGTHQSMRFEPEESLEPGTAALRTTFGSIRIDWRDEYEQLVRNLVIEFTKGGERENL